MKVGDRVRWTDEFLDSCGPDLAAIMRPRTGLVVIGGRESGRGRPITADHVRVKWVGLKTVETVPVKSLVITE